MNTPVAALRPAKMNFPTLLLGATSTAQTATMYSSGIATLLMKISISPADYKISSNTCTTTLTSGSNCSVSVTFTPQDINTRSGALTFTDNATDSPQKVGLSGVGTEVSVSPNPVPFGSITHGTTTTKTVTITNISGGSFPPHNLTFTGISVRGTGFSLTLKFAPAAAGSYSGLLTLTDNGGGSPQKITLTGTGT